LGDVRLRDVPRSPDNGLIADYYGAIDDPAAAAALLAGVPGVVGHGLFSPDMVSDVIIGSSDGVEHRAGPHMRAGG